MTAAAPARAFPQSGQDDLSACHVTAPRSTNSVPGTPPEASPFGASNINRSLSPTEFPHLLVPDLGTLWAETGGISARCWYPKATPCRPHRQHFVDGGPQAARSAREPRRSAGLCAQEGSRGRNSRRRSVTRDRSRDERRPSPMKVRRLRSNTRRVGWSRTVSGTACRPAGAPARSHSLLSWIMLVARRLLTATRSASARSADESCWGAIAACGSRLRWRNQVQHGEALGSVKNAVVAASTIVNANPGRGLEPEGASPRSQAKHRTAPGHTGSPVAGSGAGLCADRSWRPAPRSRSSRLTTCGAPVPGPTP
jgi:hypothetical protein